MLTFLLKEICEELSSLSLLSFPFCLFLSFKAPWFRFPGESPDSRWAAATPLVKLFGDASSRTCSCRGGLNHYVLWGVREASDSLYYFFYTELSLSSDFFCQFWVGYDTNYLEIKKNNKTKTTFLFQAFRGLPPRMGHRVISPTFPPSSMPRPVKPDGRIVVSSCFNSVFECHVWLKAAGGISEHEAGLSRAHGLPSAVGAHTIWWIDAVSAIHRENTVFFAGCRPHGWPICLSTPDPHIYIPPFLFISFLSFIFQLHHLPPMLLSSFLSLYLNITPYLAGVASRHSNRTVQSPWGLWDIVSCWNRTVCVFVNVLCLCVC